MVQSPHIFFPNGPAFNPVIAAQLLGQQAQGPRRRRASFAGPLPAMGQAQGRPNLEMVGGHHMVDGGRPRMDNMLQGFQMPMPAAGMPGRRRSFGHQRAQPGRNFDPSRIMHSPGRARAPSRRASVAAPSPADPLGIGMGGGVPRERGRSFDEVEDEPRGLLGRRRSSLVPGGFHPFGRGDNRGQQQGDEAALLRLLRGDQVLARGGRGYDKIKTLKQGGQSEAVNLVRSRANGKCYIEKRIRTDGERTMLALREIRTLQTVSTQYGGGRNLSVMVDYSAMMGGRIYSLILEHCNLGNVEEKMKETAAKGRHIKEIAVWNVCQGVARGLAFLHDGIKDIPQSVNSMPKPSGWDAICHLDIKPQNIFLDDRGGMAGLPRVILADFGCAVALSDVTGGQEQERQQPCGTPGWYPPEANPGAPLFYGTKTDIYMLGATLHVMCRYLELPRFANYPQLFPCGSQYSLRLNQLVVELTQMPPKNRTAARNIVPVATQALNKRVQAAGGRR